MEQTKEVEPIKSPTFLCLVNLSFHKKITSSSSSSFEFVFLFFGFCFWSCNRNVYVVLITDFFQVT